MTEISTGAARAQFSEIISRATYGKERIVLTRHGKPCAALVPIEDLTLIEELEDRADLEAIRAGLEEADRVGTISWEEVKEKLGL